MKIYRYTVYEFRGVWGEMYMVNHTFFVYYKEKNGRSTKPSPILKSNSTSF